MRGDLTYTIDERDRETGGIIRILAHVENFGMAVAAYHQALLNWPKADIVLRQKARVIRERCVP